MNVVAIIQARMASSRLPGKVMLPIEGQPMLARVVNRVAESEEIDLLVVATTTDAEDEQIEALCRELGIKSFRGHPLDVLDRVYQCAHQEKADVVVRLTGDCPLIDPGIIDLTISTFLGSEPPLDFVANRLPTERSYPIGLDTEVCSFSALQEVWERADQPYQREHVMPSFYAPSSPYHIKILHHDPDYGHLRWTVDTKEDLQLVCEVYRHFAPREDFSWLDIIKLYRDRPDLAAINMGVDHKTHLDVDQRGHT